MKEKLWKDEEKRDSVYRDLAPINSIKPEESYCIIIVKKSKRNYLRIYLCVKGIVL